ncbi:hypothetical protein SAMN05661093_11166 [Kibdelosporangium aridum]|uniref:Uncharacterized protein n=1 Tax=Kibdelosporangium aridum TaxID=2030 RepID=A0A1W2G0Y1_KIBAR|nr:hypothetical protein SAMN05661093_11166 [Kibdelosporangium aridum]
MVTVEPEDESSPDRATSSSSGQWCENTGRQRGRHRRASRTSWACVAERVLRCWPTTLRAALLMVILFSGVITLLVIAIGTAPAICVAGFGIAARLLAGRVSRRRIA